MNNIPRYSPNPLWWWSFIKDDAKGCFCEYNDYAKLEEAYKTMCIENKHHLREIEFCHQRLECLAQSIVEVRHGYENELKEITNKYNKALFLLAKNEAKMLRDKKKKGKKS